MKIKNEKTNSKKSIKNFDWKSFLNMRIFRYNFSKQLNWTSVFTLLFIIFVKVMYLTAPLLMPKGFTKLPKECDLLISCFFKVTFISFIIFNSLRIFRDEIDDGTLLIINSMPYSRLRIFFQKWFSLQVICLIYILCVVVLAPIIFTMVHGFSASAWEIFKFEFKNNNLWLIISLIATQFLFSAFTLLVLLYFSQATSASLITLFWIFFGSIRVFVTFFGRT